MEFVELPAKVLEDMKSATLLQYGKEKGFLVQDNDAREVMVAVTMDFIEWLGCGKLSTEQFQELPFSHGAFRLSIDEEMCKKERQGIPDTFITEVFASLASAVQFAPHMVVGQQYQIIIR